MEKNNPRSRGVPSGHANEDDHYRTGAQSPSSSRRSPDVTPRHHHTTNRPFGSDASSAAGDFAHVASTAARATYDAVAAEASELASNVGNELTHAAENQKGRGADIMLGFAKAITTAAEELAEQSPVVARQFRKAADGVERLSDDVRDRSVPELVHLASAYARRQPAVFFAGAVAAGFVFSRFIKSSGHSSDAPPTPGTSAQTSSTSSAAGQWSK